MLWIIIIFTPKMPKKKNNGHFDLAFFERQREAMRLRNRVVVRFNNQEKAALDELCARLKVKNRSALLRKIIMERVLQALGENHPTLF